MLRIAIAVTLAIFLLPSQRNEEITIKRHSRAGKYPLPDQILLFAELGGDAVVLNCEVSHYNCLVLAPGDYEIARLAPREGSYKDCSGVYIYRLNADRLEREAAWRILPELLAKLNASGGFFARGNAPRYNRVGIMPCQ